MPAYAAKYRQKILGNGWTPESFARDYPVPVRVTPIRVRSWQRPWGMRLPSGAVSTVAVRI